MKPVIRQGLVLFSPQGFLDGSNAATIITMAEISQIEAAEVRAVFISLKSIVFLTPMRSTRLPMPWI